MRSIIDIMAEKGLSQKELGEKIGVSQGTVSGWILGKREMGAEMRSKLVELLGEEFRIAPAEAEASAWEADGLKLVRNHIHINGRTILPMAFQHNPEKLIRLLEEEGIIVDVEESESGGVVYIPDYVKMEKQPLGDLSTKSDPVNHPSHYTKGAVETIDIIRNVTGEDFSGYCAGNIIKYISRYKHKNGLEDLQKARVYLDWLIESMRG